MHATSIPPETEAACAIRSGSVQALERGLQDSRQDTLATFEAYAAALPDLQVPLLDGLNPPLWELGHIGWFQQHWIGRNPQRARGWDADPHAAAAAADDALYDSSAVPHAARWQLSLPDARATRDTLAIGLAHTLQALATADSTDARALYFFRLVLLHEDMHHEAALYMAQRLGIAVTDPRWQAPVLPGAAQGLTLEGGRLQLGSAPDQGFCFDNECGPHEVSLSPFTIDSQVLRWADYLPFLDACAKRALPPSFPPYLRRSPATAHWQQWRHGQWRTLDTNEPACHLSALDAAAWCNWAGRRLPTEAEWVWAAQQHPDAFRWGDVWEWTASEFGPFAGFRPHPYRDYSAPWFDGRPVLKGASFMTQPRLRHPAYRNYFPAARQDMAAGFRTCAL